VGWGETGTEEKVELSPDPSQPFRRVRFQDHLGAPRRRAFVFRVISGTAKSGDDVLNTRATRTSAWVSFPYSRHRTARTWPAFQQATFGATVKLKHTHTVIRCAQPSARWYCRARLFPEPVMCEAISPRPRRREKMAAGWGACARKTRVPDRGGREIKQTLLYGQGEMQLDVSWQAQAQVRRGNQPEAPRIPHRETIRAVRGELQAQEAERRPRQFGEVYIRLAPLARGGGFEFVDAIVAAPSRQVRPIGGEGDRRAMAGAPCRAFRWWT